MTLPTSYLTSSKNLSAILDAITTAQAPSKFTTRFLVNLEFKSTSDRLVIGVLKSLGFLSFDTAMPTDRYFQFLDQTQSKIVLAEGIREAYGDLFQVDVNAHTLTKSAVTNKLKTLTQGQYSENVLDKMGMTFVALCKLADFETRPADSPIEEAPVVAGENGEKSEDQVEEIEQEPVVQKKMNLGGLHYNIQLILPESRDPKVYDALFRSLNEHLLK